jgi:hypothetical protein
VEAENISKHLNAVNSNLHIKYADLYKKSLPKRESTSYKYKILIAGLSDSIKFELLVAGDCTVAEVK